MWWPVAEMALCLWLHQPTRALGQDGHDTNDGDGNHVIRIKKNINILQVNQQNHMVANKFDPRMDPVVVQVSLVIIAIITNSDSDIVIAIIVPVLMAKRQ